MAIDEINWQNLKCITVVSLPVLSSSFIFLQPLFYRDQIKSATVEIQFNSIALLNKSDYSPLYLLIPGPLLLPGPQSSFI